MSENNTKRAAAKDQEFEQAFFQLAYDKLQGKLYNLLPYLVGFELVKKTDNNKAVGVFGFKADNGHILFVPTFFINGKIKDMDLLYSKTHEGFYPLNEEYAKQFLTDSETGLGRVSREGRNDIARDQAGNYMRDLVYPPRTGRVSYASVKADDDFCAGLTKEAESMLEKYKEYTSVELTDFLKVAGEGASENLVKLMRDNIEFCNAVSTFYPPEKLAEALVIRKEEKKKEDKLTLHKFEDVDPAKKLSKEEAAKITKEGYLITDKRTSEEVSKVGIVQYNQTFASPTKSGFYPYITKLGTIRTGLVLLKPQQFDTSFASSHALIINLDLAKKGQTYMCPANEIVVKDLIEVGDLHKEIEKLSEPMAEGMPGYDEYILLDSSLRSTQPFKIVENYKDNAGIRRLRIDPLYSSQFSPEVDSYKVGKPGSYDSRLVTLVMTKKQEGSLEFRNKAVYVPKNYKLVKIETACNYLDFPSCISEEQAKKEAEKVRQGAPGNFSDLDGFLRSNNVFPLTVQSNGSDYFVDVDAVRKSYGSSLECKIGMVVDYGVTEKQAEDVLSALNGSNKLNGCIKLAYLGDYTLPVYDEQPSTNSLGQPEYYGTPYYAEDQTPDPHRPDSTALGFGVVPDQNNVNNNVRSAVNLAQAGQKEIFDTQAIATLAKYINPNDKILEFVPSFIGTLDKLGRMLFMTYWDVDKFEKMYGRDELPELVELVRNVFNNLGDLITFMKRKTPDISINVNEQTADNI